MCVANVGALLIFAGWLWQSGRLDAARMRAARALFAPTIAEDRAAAAAREEALLRAAEAADAARQRGDPPWPAGAQIERVSLIQAQTEQAARRLQDRTAQLMQEVNVRSAQLDQRKAELEARERALDDRAALESGEKRDEQFAAAVRLYETLAGPQAKRMLLALIERQGGDLDLAARYLTAMSPRAAAKTLKELKTEKENELATGLLEHIRTLGTRDERDGVREASGHDDALPPAG
jgi:hypothetical protein